jgi:voltage-gated potassium channel
MNENFKIITDNFENKSFKEVFETLLEKNIILIGIIENYGNINEFKKEYVKEAEKSPNINELYKQIHNLKNIQTNKIIISPNSNYVIQKHSALIVIERT